MKPEKLVVINKNYETEFRRKVEYLTLKFIWD